MFCFPIIEVPAEFNPLSFHHLCVDMHVNETKLVERNSSLEYDHITCIGKTEHTSFAAAGSSVHRPYFYARSWSLDILRV